MSESGLKNEEYFDGMGNDAEAVRKFINIPKEDLIGKIGWRCFDIFNNFSDKLPGDPSFNRGINSTEKETFGEEFGSDYSKGAKQDMTQKVFFEAVKDAVLKCGLNIEVVEQKNRCVSDAHHKIFELDKEGKTQD